MSKYQVKIHWSITKKTTLQLTTQADLLSLDPFLLQISPTSCFQCLSCRGRAAKDRTRGAVGQVPPGVDSHCSCHCWSLHGHGQRCCHLYHTGIRFGTNQKGKCYLRQAGYPQGKRLAPFSHHCVVPQAVFSYGWGLMCIHFPFPHCHSAALTSRPNLTKSVYAPAQNPILPSTGFISSPTRPVARSPISSFSQWGALCFPSDLNSSLPVWAMNHSE